MNGKHPDSPANEDTRLNPFNGAIARRCACRGWIVGPELPEKAAQTALERHQLEEQHKTWRQNELPEWVRRNTTDVDIPVRLRKVE